SREHPRRARLPRPLSRPAVPDHRSRAVRAAGPGVDGGGDPPGLGSRPPGVSAKGPGRRLGGPRDRRPRRSDARGLARRDGGDLRDQPDVSRGRGAGPERGRLMERRATSVAHLALIAWLAVSVGAFALSFAAWPILVVVPAMMFSAVRQARALPSGVERSLKILGWLLAGAVG